jgi:hypothetical protein
MDDYISPEQAQPPKTASLIPSPTMDEGKTKREMR